MRCTIISGILLERSLARARVYVCVRERVRKREGGREGGRDCIFFFFFFFLSFPFCAFCDVTSNQFKQAHKNKRHTNPHI